MQCAEINDINTQMCNTTDGTVYYCLADMGYS